MKSAVVLSVRDLSLDLRPSLLDEAGLGQFSVRDISPATIPFDFERNARIHKCYELHRN